jgi:hypothetical protein
MARSISASLPGSMSPFKPCTRTFRTDPLKYQESTIGAIRFRSTTFRRNKSRSFRVGDRFEKGVIDLLEMTGVNHAFDCRQLLWTTALRQEQPGYFQKYCSLCEACQNIASGVGALHCVFP